MQTRPTLEAAVEERRGAVNRLLEELAALCEQDLPPAAFGDQLLQAADSAFGHVAGVVWCTTPQGHLQIQSERNFRQLGDASRSEHDEFRRLASSRLQPLVVPANGTVGNLRNRSPLVGFLVPILIEKQLAGLIEVWRESGEVSSDSRYHLHFLATLAQLAATHLRAHRLRRISGEQQVWAQLEAFSRGIHGSLDPTVVAYRVANDSRRLIGCDRVSVVLCPGRRARVEAISGAAVVERRSNVVHRLAALAAAVRQWGEPLIYRGEQDDALPPDVLTTLDAYLAESRSKFLVVLPLRMEEDADSRQPIRSILVAECFETDVSFEQVFSRTEVIGRHAVSALGNALDHRRIPFRWLSRPLVWLQDGIGGKAQAITASVVLATIALVAILTCVPYPLKMDGRGQLLPQARAWLYAPVEGHVVRFDVVPGMEVYEGQPLVLMHDSSLALKLVNLEREIQAAEKEIQGCNARFQAARSHESERLTVSIERHKHEAIRNLKVQERDRLRALTNSEESAPGNFWVRSPAAGRILNFDFRETLTGKFVRPSEPLLRIGDQLGAWEVELKVPHKHIGQILRTFEQSGKAELDVDLLPLSAPTQTFRGKLARDQVAGEATPDAEDRSETEPVVTVRVRVDGSDIPPAQRLPRHLLLSGSEVHAKVRCDNHPLGYALFYGAWEFFYEKVVFFF